MISFFTFILVVWCLCLPAIGNHVPSYCIGVDCGTESVRVGIWDTNQPDPYYPVVSKSVSYKTNYPQPGWAEQNPIDWWNCLGQAMKQCIEEGKIDIQYVKGLAIDCTACSVCVLDENFEPMRPCILWMDQRSAPQTKLILEKARGNQFLRVNLHGKGPLSAEWMIPKSLWLKQNEPVIWGKCRVICEKQDFLNFKLTGLLTSSGCNVAARWNWDAILACKRRYFKDKSYDGMPHSLLKSIDLEDIVEKWPNDCVGNHSLTDSLIKRFIDLLNHLAMGERIGCLTNDAANFLGLKDTVQVVQGGPDAYVGMIGSGCINPGKMCLITGSSHLHLAVSNSNNTAGGIWGAYGGAPLLDLNFAEGGQSSTGSALQWARRIFNASFNDLDNEAAMLEPGSDGLLVYEKFQGSRTPVTDPLMRASFIGLSLAHSRGHIWRSILEAICYGTKQAIDALTAAGHKCDEIFVAGGATRSKFFLQMHSDVCGIPISCNFYDNAPLLGGAILAYAGSMNSSELNSSIDIFDDYVHDIHNKIQIGIDKLVKVSHVVQPNLNATAKYNQMYKLYKQIPQSIKDITHALVLKNVDDECQKNAILPSSRIGILSPSLLSANFGCLLDDTSKCVNAGATHIHIDMCDGGSDFCLGSLTFGPELVAVIKSEYPNLFIDVHLVCQEKTLFNILEPLERAGTDRIIIQFESFKQFDSENHIQLLCITANMIRKKGMKVGICIKPSTPVEEIDVLLNMKYKEESLFEMVNILSVEPGFRKQSFNLVVIDKIKYVYEKWGDSLVDIACDGAITNETAKNALCAGANYLISGGFIFDSGRSEIINQYKKLYREIILHGK